MNKLVCLLSIAILTITALVMRKKNNCVFFLVLYKESDVRAVSDRSEIEVMRSALTPSVIITGLLKMLASADCLHSK